MTKLVRFWIVFESSASAELPLGARLGCGVTAYNFDDAIQLLRVKMFSKEGMPRIQDFVENIDVSTLDPGHVLPNMGNPARRGIWFPLGYEP